MAEADERNEGLTSGLNGGTSGTFATETSGSGVGAGATGQDGGTDGPLIGRQGTDDDTGGLAQAEDGDDVSVATGSGERPGSSAMSPQAAASGDMSAGRSEGGAAEANVGAVGGGEVGGMGGVRSSTTGGNPPGGVSPMGSSKD